ncbi:MAG: sulfite exporter TauE/SafE family protein [Defluviitaleaceae bacterium]|nr:sulfite exporter TauE/SafE family protein [Defluviitaleaceae bacterium]
MRKNKTKKLHTAVGIVVGIANGLFGAGGGTLLVPALQKFMKLETKKSHATALAVILPLSVISAAIYIWGVDVDWKIVLLVSAGGVCGGVVGAKLLNKLAAWWLNILFGLFLAVGSVRMLFS